MSNQVVLTVSPAVLEEMKRYYERSLSAKVPPGGVFAAKTSACSIAAYKSGKVLFQGTGSAGEAARWQAIALPSAAAPVKQAKTTRYTPPAGISSMSIVGSDEVGTGDYFGPITVVAVYVDKEQIPLLRELGVRDSKDLNDEQISAIARKLMPVVPYSLLVLPNEKYNELQQGGKNQGELKAILHNRAIATVLEKIQPNKPEGILIDQFVQPDTYYKYLSKQKVVQRENVYFSTKGESVHLAVAAASILARYAFVQRFAELSQKAGFTLPKGAGAQVDQAAAKLIRMHGEERLKEFAKLHFANTEKARKHLRK